MLENSSFTNLFNEMRATDCKSTAALTRQFAPEILAYIRQNPGHGWTHIAATYLRLPWSVSTRAEKARIRSYADRMRKELDPLKRIRTVSTERPMSHSFPPSSFYNLPWLPRAYSHAQYAFQKYCAAEYEFHRVELRGWWCERMYGYFAIIDPNVPAVCIVDTMEFGFISAINRLEEIATRIYLQHVVSAYRVTDNQVVGYELPACGRGVHPNRVRWFLYLPAKPDDPEGRQTYEQITLAWDVEHGRYGVPIWDRTNHYDVLPPPIATLVEQHTPGPERMPMPVYQLGEHSVPSQENVVMISSDNATSVTIIPLVRDCRASWRAGEHLIEATSDGPSNAVPNALDLSKLKQIVGSILPPMTIGFAPRFNISSAAVSDTPGVNGNHRQIDGELEVLTPDAAILLKQSLAGKPVPLAAFINVGAGAVHPTNSLGQVAFSVLLRTKFNTAERELVAKHGGETPVGKLFVQYLALHYEQNGTITLDEPIYALFERILSGKVATRARGRGWPWRRQLQPVETIMPECSETFATPRTQEENIAVIARHICRKWSDLRHFFKYTFLPFVILTLIFLACVGATWTTISWLQSSPPDIHELDRLPAVDFLPKPVR